MPCVRDLEPTGRRGVGDAERGRHVAESCGAGEPVDSREDRRRRPAFERVGTRAGPQLAHHRRGPDPAARDVADHQIHRAIGILDRVVPVAAHVDTRAAGQISSRELDAGDVGQAVGEEASLERLRHAVLVPVEAGVVGRERAPVREVLRDAEVGLFEPPR